MNTRLEVKQLKLIDIELEKNLNFTHKRKHSNGYYKSWIDHVFCKKTDNFISGLQIIENSDNFSDHNQITFNIDAELDKTKKNLRRLLNSTGTVLNSDNYIKKCLNRTLSQFQIFSGK